MSFEDKSIECSDCGTSFTFSAAEQEFFASKGFTNDPKRCPQCRQTRKAERFNRAYGYRFQQRFPTTCSQCGKETEVPFEPREGRPVYCSDCYITIKQSQ